MDKCLIVKTSSLGDVIQTFPVVNYLSTRFPNIQIDWVVEDFCAELVQHHPAVAKAHIVRTRQWRRSWISHKTLNDIKSVRNALQEKKYDCIFDLQGNIKSGLITSLARGKHKVGFGWKTVPEWPNILFTGERFNPSAGKNIREDYLFLVQSFLQDNIPYVDSGTLLQLSREQQDALHSLWNTFPQKIPKIMVCPGSAWKNKQLSETTLIEFLQRIHAVSGCYFLFIWGSPTEHALVQQLQNSLGKNASILEKLPLPMLQNLMSRMQQVISMDSLPLHLAGSAAVSTFSIFGASSAKKYQPMGSSHHAFQGTCPYGRIFEKRCPLLRTCPTGACIHHLTSQELFAAWSFSFDRIGINHPASS
jgi:heptosyltransferase-1